MYPELFGIPSSLFGTGFASFGVLEGLGENLRIPGGFSVIWDTIGQRIGGFWGPRGSGVGLGESQRIPRIS